MVTAARFLITLIAVLVLFGCGQKGSLYLPSDAGQDQDEEQQTY